MCYNHCVIKIYVNKKGEYILYKRVKILVIILITLILVSGCEKKIVSEDVFEATLRLQWHTQSQFAGYFVAKEKGYYEEENIRINIEEGGYGKNCINTVKHGAEEFGVSKWVSISKENNLISIAQIVKDSGMVLISKKEKGIEKIEDLKNKKIGTWLVGNQYQLYTFLKSANINREDVELIRQDWNIEQILNDEIDLASAMTYNELLLFDKEDLNIIDYKDYGIIFPGQSIFTSKEFYNENKEICKKFVRASLKGWEYAIKNPKEASEIVLKYDKENRLNAEHELKQIKEIIKLINNKKYELGYHYKNRMNKILKDYGEYEIIDKDLNIESVYTNEFIELKQ